MRTPIVLLATLCAGVSACSSAAAPDGAPLDEGDPVFHATARADRPLAFAGYETETAFTRATPYAEASPDAGDAGSSAFTPCASYLDCSGGTVCASNRVCRQACDCPKCCPSGDACAGAAYNPPPGDEPNTCVARCASDDDCTGGQRCQSGFCTFSL